MIKLEGEAENTSDLFSDGLPESNFKGPLILNYDSSSEGENSPQMKRKYSSGISEEEKIPETKQPLWKYSSISENEAPKPESTQV